METLQISEDRKKELEEYIKQYKNIGITEHTEKLIELIILQQEVINQLEKKLAKPE